MRIEESRQMNAWMEGIGGRMWVIERGIGWYGEKGVIEDWGALGELTLDHKPRYLDLR